MTESLRRLGSGEHLLWLTNQNRPNHVVIAAEIHGRTTPSDWRAALDHTQQRHPLLSAAIKTDSQGEPSFVRSTNAVIPLRVVKGTGAEQLREVMTQELATSFGDAAQAPLMRSVLLHEAERSVLVLAAHHAVTDGISLTFVIRDLLESLSGKELQPLPPAASREELAAGILRERAEEKPPSPPTPGEPGAYVPEGSLPRLELLQLDPELTAAVRARARREHSSVHGALCAAIARAGEGRWHGREMRFFSPFDLRRMTGAPEESAYLIVPFTLRMPAEKIQDFWSAAREVNRQVKQARLPESLRAYMKGIDTMLARKPGPQQLAEMARQAASIEGIITNLGVLQYGTDFGALQLQALWGAVLVGYVGEQVIFAVTVDGRLCLTLASHEPWPGMLPGIERALRDACV